MNPDSALLHPVYDMKVRIKTHEGLELEKLTDGDTLNLHSVRLTLPVRVLYEDVLGLIDRPPTEM